MKKQHEIPTGKLSMMKQHWMPIAIVVGFALVLFLVVRYDVLYEQEPAKPQKMTPKEREVLRKKEKSLRYRKAFVPQQLQEKSVKEEAKRLANWKANFPWKPSHDATLKFDPLRHINGGPVGTFERRRQGPPNSEDSEAGTYHMRLKKFFADEARFSLQFQQVYEILNENGRGHNPALVADVFHELRRYKDALTIPEDWQPREIMPRNRMRINGQEIPEEWVRERRRRLNRTREEHIEGYYNNILATLTDLKWLNTDYWTDEGMEEAKRIRDRLINEVQGMEELPSEVMDYGISHGLGSNSPEAQGLLSGEEEMLVPYEGWYEEARGFYANQRYHFRRSIEEGDPSLKALMPELFPPVKIKNGVLVDKDGDPVKHFEGANYRIINHKHESFPMPVNEDGTIRLPTLEEMEQLRSEGKVRQLPPGEAILGIDPYLANPNSVEPAMDQLND